MSGLLFVTLCGLGLAGPLVALAWGGRVYPHRPLVLLTGAAAVLSLSLVAWPDLVVPLVALEIVIAALALADIWSLPRRRDFEISRSAVRSASLAKPHGVTLVVTNHSKRSRTVWIRDGVPAELEATPAEFLVLLPPESQITLEYSARSRRRGAFNLAQTHLKVTSRWGLWQRYLDYDVATALHVYPDMVQLARYAVLARRDRLNLVGVRRSRRLGQDNEFERLRDYTPDDNPKHVDWRSTARRGRLTVKDYQQNQSQRLVFLIDCGRMMANQAAGLSLLDHAFNAMLMLSYVALTRGDAVGLVCFSDEIHSFTPPRGGLGQMNRLLHAVFDQFPRLVESRYDQAFLQLARRASKRALVVLVTNVIDEVNSHQVQEYLANLVGRHLPLGVLLRDRRVFQAAEQVDPRGTALYQAAAAADLLCWRRQVLADLTSRGVLTLDTYPEDLTAPLVNRYLEVKARHLL